MTYITAESRLDRTSEMMGALDTVTWDKTEV